MHVAYMMGIMLSQFAGSCILDLLIPAAFVVGQPLRLYLANLLLVIKSIKLSGFGWMLSLILFFEIDVGLADDDGTSLWIYTDNVRL